MLPLKMLRECCRLGTGQPCSDAPRSASLFILSGLAGAVGLDPAALPHPFIFLVTVIKVRGVSHRTTTRIQGFTTIRPAPSPTRWILRRPVSLRDRLSQVNRQEWKCLDGHARHEARCAPRSSLTRRGNNSIDVRLNSAKMEKQDA